MRKSVIAFAAAVLGASTAGAQKAPPSIDAIFNELSAEDGPGCAIGIAKSGQPVLTKGFGSAELEHGAAIQPDTVFEAGSVSKQFTAAAILLLVEDGRISLGDDVRRYIPELPNYGQAITINHLLNHTSGLREWSALVDAAGWPRMTRAHAHEDALDIVLRQRALNHIPGAEYSYTNSGYVLLVELVNRLTGSSLAEFSSARIFQPLGMKATRWRDNFRRIEPKRAVAYRRNPEGAWEQAMPFESAYGGGGLLTTVGDLLIWNEALTNGKLGARVTRRLQEQSRLGDGRQISYARGLFVNDVRGAREVSHGGATAGYRAWIGRYPDHQLSIALLCNAAQATAEKLARDVAAKFLPDTRAAGALPQFTDDLTRRAGLFVNRTTGVPLQMEIREGALAIVGGPVLKRITANAFELNNRRLRFVSPGEVEITGGDDPVRRLLRSAAFTPNAKQVRDFVGRYRSDEVDAVYSIKAEGNNLLLAVEGAPQAKMILRPVYADAFMAEGTLIRFRRDPAGKVVALRRGEARVWDLPFTRLRS